LGRAAGIAGIAKLPDIVSGRSAAFIAHKLAMHHLQNLLAERASEQHILVKAVIRIVRR
jgi:hypothetical protein